MSPYRFVHTKDGITVVAGDKSMWVPRTSVQYARVLNLLKEATDDDALEQAARKLIEAGDIERILQQYGNGHLKLADDGESLTYGNETLAPSLTARVLTCIRTGVPFVDLANFIDRLYQNPSRRARQELYAFLEYSHLPITPTGCFMAYKAIRNDWTDKHTGTFSNRVGECLQMSRRAVDDDATRGCSYGFHVGTLEYVTSFACGYGTLGGDRIVVVECDPADVVSVPLDCSCQKVRTCKYRVVALYDGPLPQGGVADSSEPYETGYDDDGDIEDPLDEPSESDTAELRVVELNPAMLNELRKTVLSFLNRLS